MPKPYAVLTITAGQTQTVVAGVAGQKITVLHFTLTTDTDTSISWKSGSNVISGPSPIGAQGGFADGFVAPLIGDTLGLFETNAGEDLILYSSVAATIGGHLTYIVKNSG